MTWSPAGSPAPCASRCPRTVAGRIEFRIGDELASVSGGHVVEGPIDAPDAVVAGDPPAFYCLLVERDIDAVEVTGDADLVRALVASLPPAPPAEMPA